MNFSGQIKTRELEVFTAMPAALRAPRESSQWGEANKPGQAVEAFIEGPTFLPDGRLAVTDIPFGRILTVTPGGDWEVVADYDGEPNGMALDADGSLIIADYVRGLLRLDIATGKAEPILSRRNGEGFKGLNDVVRAPDGALFFTDQGQTGLHDQSGRVYRLHDGRLDALLGNGISPNGLALTPDGQVLFVAMTRDNSVWRIPLRPDGGVAKVGRFCQLFGTSGPDGLAMTASGELLLAHASLGAVFRFAPNGELVERLVSPVGPTVTNLTFDPAAPHRLVATESSSNTVLTTTLDVPGLV
ncbi:SMP-30/gluconolactonase/LRE family protein [Arthrobacter globiformis]|uniref:SMP-30/gluconolactonase/LRE family protein n=1 Tax=Arthrobacter globiformis TaxID=1665 RepID=UPI000B4084CF|nr:SMP-30/gluconolactonase/LRE family protein [Arthrobacter globiformis]